jgi:hypothetical protein
MAQHLIFEIANDSEKPNLLHVTMIAANEMRFDVSFPSRDYAEVIKDICNVAPSMMSYDSDLMEAFDDAFRTQLNPTDIANIKQFVAKYQGLLSNVEVDFLEEGAL